METGKRLPCVALKPGSKWPGAIRADLSSKGQACMRMYCRCQTPVQLQDRQADQLDPVLAQLQQQLPTQLHGGYPVLHDGCLAWPGAPLFVLGTLALLTLGPIACAPCFRTSQCVKACSLCTVMPCALSHMASARCVVHEHATTG